MKKISLFKQTGLLSQVVTIPLIAILSLQLAQANHFSSLQDSTGNYTVSGKLKDYDSGWIYLRHGEGLKQGQQIDSTKIIHGEFTFNGKVSGIEPFMLGVHFKDNKGNILPSTQYQGPFILSPGKLYGEGKFESPNFWTFSGTKEQDEYNSYKSKLHVLFERSQQIKRKKNNLKKTERKLSDQLNAELVSIENEINDAIRMHVSQNSSSQVAAYIAKSNLANTDPLISRAIYELLDSTVKESLYGKELLQFVLLKEPTGIGHTAPPLNLPDHSGQLHALSNYRGSYVLIDFWASWCGPCRLENPNLVKVQHTYAPKGLKIISISVDTDMHAWQKAVSEDKLFWLQLSDLKGVKSETGKQYGITHVPMNFLLDKEGKIIGRDLKGNELWEKLKEIL